ncbi:MAG: hypothetical protein HY868_08645 [Chloroflexi bacterium]|nr:hypothetical protein [Chloroflexota bacterium]
MNTISSPTRKLYRHLRSETIQIFYRWKVYRQLFSSPEVIGLLDKSARRLFLTLQYDLLDAIALALGRLTDRSETRLRNKVERNACLQQLVESSEVVGDLSLEQKINQHLTAVRAKCKRIDIWRNKWAAHRDYQAAVKLDPNWKIGFSPAEVNGALSELCAFMNEFEGCFRDSEREFVSIEELKDFEDHKIYPPTPYDQLEFDDDGETLLELLRKATNA